MKDDYFQTKILNQSKSFLDHLYNYNITYWLQNQYKLRKVINILSDEQSIENYEKEIIFKILRPIMGEQVNYYIDGILVKDFNKLCEKYKNQEFKKAYGGHFDNIRAYCFACTFDLLQYQYDNIVKVNKGDTFFDVGACFGDTAAWAAKNGASEIYSFEIDALNLEVLEKYNDSNINIVNKAIGSSNKKIGLTRSPTNPGATKINLASDQLNIEMTTIDDFCKSNGILPDFIKMDIEGSELDALKGARNTLIQKRPKLAICLYHKNQDMWEIPLYLKEVVPEYNFYCKKSHPFYEFILFATIDNN